MKTITFSDEEIRTLVDALNVAGGSPALVPGLQTAGRFAALMAKLEFAGDAPTCANPHVPGVRCDCQPDRAA